MRWSQAKVCGLYAHTIFTRGPHVPGMAYTTTCSTIAPSKARFHAPSDRKLEPVRKACKRERKAAEARALAELAEAEAEQAAKEADEIVRQAEEAEARAEAAKLAKAKKQAARKKAQKKRRKQKIRDADDEMTRKREEGGAPPQ